jgi:hypothetical protein
MVLTKAGSRAMLRDTKRILEQLRQDCGVMTTDISGAARPEGATLESYVWDFNNHSRDFDALLLDAEDARRGDRKALPGIMTALFRLRMLLRQDVDRINGALEALYNRIPRDPEARPEKVRLRKLEYDQGVNELEQCSRWLANAMERLDHEQELQRTMWQRMVRWMSRVPFSSASGAAGRSAVLQGETMMRESEDYARLIATTPYDGEVIDLRREPEFQVEIRRIEESRKSVNKQLRELNVVLRQMHDTASRIRDELRTTIPALEQLGDQIERNNTRMQIIVELQEQLLEENGPCYVFFVCCISLCIIGFLGFFIYRFKVFG